MPSSFQLELDTTPPAASLDAEILFPGAALVSIASDDAFQMKLWGDVDGADPNIQPTEDESSWLMHQPTYLLALLRIDGPNTIYARVRDDLLNPSGAMAVTLAIDIVPVAGLVRLALSPPSSVGLSKVNAVAMAQESRGSIRIARANRADLEEHSMTDVDLDLR